MAVFSRILPTITSAYALQTGEFRILLAFI